MADGGKTPMFTIADLQEWGAARVSLPITALFAATKGMFEALQIVMREGITPTVNHPEKVVTFKEFTELVGLPEIKRIEEKYVKGL
jgi:methylisocitrate lyase